jgi:hypothetical protein
LNSVRSRVVGYSFQGVFRNGAVRPEPSDDPTI